jgi:hypothetical protein
VDSAETYCRSTSENTFLASHYVTLIDHHATRDDAEAIGIAVIDLLISERLIQDSPNSDCVHSGIGYPPGPRVGEIYTRIAGEGAFWIDRSVNGVKVCAERYVNFFGFPIFECAVCPSCHASFAKDPSVMDQLYQCVGNFLNDDRFGDICCPTCLTSAQCTSWTTVPDIGLAYLGIEFWNWPPLSMPSWRISIPELIADRLGRTMSIGWGRL